jgi:hypothetical protein
MNKHSGTAERAKLSQRWRTWKSISKHLRTSLSLHFSPRQIPFNKDLRGFVGGKRSRQVAQLS